MKGVVLRNTDFKKITLQFCSVNWSLLVIQRARLDINKQNTMVEIIEELLPYSHNHGQKMHIEALFKTLKLGEYSEISAMIRKHFFERKNFLVKKRVKKKNAPSNSFDSINKLCFICICHYSKELVFIRPIHPRSDLLGPTFSHLNCYVNFSKSYPALIWYFCCISCEKIIKLIIQQMYRNLYSIINFERAIYSLVSVKCDYSKYKFGNKVPSKKKYSQCNNAIQLQKAENGNLALSDLSSGEKTKMKLSRTKVENSTGNSIFGRNSLKIKCDTPLDDLMQSKSEDSTEGKSGELSDKKKGESGLDIVPKDHEDMGRGFRWSVYSQNYWSRQSFFQSLSVYPLSNQPFKSNPLSPSAQEQRRPNNQRDAINNLMRYEVFRLCSFSFTQFPPNVDLWVTQLAQSGFYVVGSGGRVRCFSCGCEYADFLVGSPIDNAHGPNCQRHEYNRNLNEWTHGLNTEDLAPYFTAFGSLTPNLFNDSETSQRVGISLSLPQTVGGDYGSNALSNSTHHAEHFNRGNEVSDTGFSEIGDYTETPKPSSAPPMGNGDSNYVYFTSEAHSLPTYLNTVSGALVSQESHESNSREVLTSVARQPMSIDNAPTQRASNVQAQDGQDQNSSEEGAVGGSVLPSFDLSRASYPQFASSTARRTTFNGWNPDHPQRPEDLVTGGFFYAGYADCVRCFYCGLGLKYWRPNDIPAYQHARFRPHCVYNRMYKGQEYIDRVQQDIQNEQTQVNQTGSETTQTPSVPTPSTPITAGSTNSSSTSDPEHAYLRLTVAQEALRAGWRSEQIIQAISHIVEEIGITSQSIQLDILIDVLVSLYSANDQPEAPNLSSGDSDSAGDSSRNIGDRPVDPNIATVRPTIPASVTSKLAERSLGFERADGGDDDHADTNEVSDGPNTLEMTQAVERENAYLSQRTMCGICHERPVSCVFLPCGHVIACQPCADISTTCKLCHKNIVATANIFLA
ncbi:unnamed protein product [Lymnaea stagnalis]|uniref:RING-type domain-containing protein n=1 Tax=Lymnaea stagnalis TaxID=6523 RepID=A0AAV2HVI1_LYMST